MGSLSEIKKIYQQTNKPKDFLFNQLVCRPPAAALVYLLKDRRITPNQVTFLSLAMALLANALLLLVLNHAGLILAALCLQFAFILDCTDGQLARIRGTSSTVGGLLDFLMDEIKAVALVASIGGRLSLQAYAAGSTAAALFWLSMGLVAAFIVAVGISLTTFIRRPEYLALFPAPPPEAPTPQPSLLGRVISACEWAGRSVINYPSWFWLPAILGKVEWFFIPYVIAHFLYLGRTSLSVLWTLAKPLPK